MVDNLECRWNTLDESDQKRTELIQIKIDNGLESSGRRTQFLNRMVTFVDLIGKPVQLLYYRPSHSRYNPIERCLPYLEAALECDTTCRL